MDKGAVLSACGLYRYYLYRSWNAALPRMGVVMLNPSTADASNDDPTIGRVVSFATSYGYGRVDVCNLFALRCTEPEGLSQSWANASEPANPHANTQALKMMAGLVDRLVIAWGNPKYAKIDGRGQGTIICLRDWGWHPHPLYCFKHNADGTPSHPLYLPGDTQLVQYEGEHP